MKSMNLRDEQKGALLLGFLFAIIIVVGIFFAVSLKTDNVAEKLANDQVVRVLYVLDDDEGNVLFSNVLIYYPVSRKAATVNIPGNTGAIYKSLGRVDRIDDVYKEKGIELYKSEVENLLGCKIPFYLTMKLDGFVRVTDMLGGLRVFIPAPVDATGENGERWLLPSGAVTLDGDKIAAYIKYRVEDEHENDIQERYQNVVTAFYATVHDRKSSMFVNKRVFQNYANLMHMNLKPNDAYRLMSEISDMDAETISKQTVTGPIRIVDGQRLLFPLNNGEFIKEAVKQRTNMLLSESAAFVSRVYVLEIKNGTPTQGLAHNTSILFQNASYDVLSAVNADRNDYEKTVIIDHIGNKEIANMVGEFIHCTNIQEEEVDLSRSESDTAADVDFTVILGRDFDGRYVRASRNEQAH